MARNWTESRLQNFITSEIEESLTLEYKAAEALDRNETKKKEITKDVSAMANSAGGILIYGISEYGDPERDAEALRKLSPLTYIDRVNAPLLILQGVNDPRVPVGEAVQMHELLAKRGVPAPLILFAEEGHGAGRRSAAVQQLGHTLKFFDEHLKKKPAG